MKIGINVGFTLIELMVTVTLVAITLTMGIPSLVDMVRTNRMAGYVNDMVAEYNFARSEAMKRSSFVTLCKRNAAGNACNNSASWVSGWIVFADTNGDGSIDTEEPILRVHPALTGLTSISYANNRVTIDGSGYATGFAGVLSFCDARGVTKAKGRELYNSGRLGTVAVGHTLTCS